MIHGTSLWKTMENHHFVMGNLTISTGPFSMSQTVSLPEGIFNGGDFCMTFLMTFFYDSRIKL
jgi:hypothetical protein